MIETTQDTVSTKASSVKAGDHHGHMYLQSGLEWEGNLFSFLTEQVG